MNISNNYRNCYMNAYSARNTVKKESQPPVSNPTVQNNSVSFGSRSPLINLMILDALTTPPPKPKKKVDKKEDNHCSSTSSRYESDEKLEEYKQKALDNDIVVKSVTRKIMEPAMVKVEIDGKDYDFYTHIDDEYDANYEASYATSSEVGRKNSSWHNNRDELAVLIRNVKDQHRGKFVREGDADVFIPFVLGQKPDISKDVNVLKYGNAEFPHDHGGLYRDNALSAIGDALGKSVSSDDVKLIEYVEKVGNEPYCGLPSKENDNIERKYAFGYYDENTDTRCLYIENKDEPKQIIKQDEEGNIETIEIK